MASKVAYQMNEEIKKRLNLLMDCDTSHLAQAIALLSGYCVALENRYAQNPYSDTCEEGWSWEWAQKIGVEERTRPKTAARESGLTAPTAVDSGDRLGSTLNI
jgi:hypothetical protein